MGLSAVYARVQEFQGQVVVQSRPGVGTWLANAISYRDYPVLEAGILFLSILFVLVNLLVDISYAIINPRIRYG